MLRTGPWYRLPLTIRWLKQDYSQDFHPDLSPPVYMAVAYGEVKSKKVTADTTSKKPSNGVSSKEEGDDDDDLVDLSQCRNKHLRCCVCRKFLQVSENYNRPVYKWCDP
jgi:hypothetical protein